jgi:chorismate mutase / prephenate dehydrogenase
MNEDPAKAFEQVRQDIDTVDAELVSLISRRLALTGRVGELKAQLNLPLYVPSREEQLIADKRQRAIDQGVCPDLVEDVLRRIMRESYQRQNTRRSQVAVTQSRSIVVVGGNGQLGQLFVQLFEQSGYSVCVIEKNDWAGSSRLFAKASLVMVAVPIAVTNQVIENLSGLSKDCLLVDVTSVKQSPLKTMLKVHKGPVVGLHPMFGPDIATLAKQTVVVCHGRGEAEAQWLIEQLNTWGAQLSYVSAQQHDRLMSIVQVLRHFSTVAYGYHLKEENIDLDDVLELSSPIYRLELIMVGRLFAQDSKLYSDIIFSDKKNIPMVKRFVERMLALLELLEKQDKQSFELLFNDVSCWFGEHADKFLLESNLMLAKANDLK